MSFRQPATQREYGPGQRLLALIPAAALFLFVLPFGLMVAGRVLDRSLGLTDQGREPGRRILAVLLALPGWALAIWSIQAQFTRGLGTPLPMMASQRLVVEPPYTHSRNPMALGTFMAYLGMAIWRGSRSAAVLVVVLLWLLLTYIKRVEEPELLARFGESYLNYRDRTPFLIPRVNWGP